MEESEERSLISDISASVLRLGVATSACVMLIGILFSFVHGTTSVERMDSDGFDYRPAVMWHGIEGGRGKSIIDAGIYLLVLTPVMRVAAAMILFAASGRDWLYTAITFVVLIMVMTGLLWHG